MSFLGRIAVDHCRILLMYKEVLPEDCPPDRAGEIEQNLAVFRLRACQGGTAAAGVQIHWFDNPDDAND